MPLRKHAGRALHFIRTLPLRFKNAERVFTRIHDRNDWRGGESISGPGSDRAATAQLRRSLPALLAELGVRSLLDAPCGDFLWMSETALDLESYVGIDIVASVIAANQERHAAPGRTFRRLDLLSEPLPRADLILCRDALVHFSFRDVRRALAAFRQSGSTWLLATTFPALAENRDIVTGEWRPLRLDLPPFHLPPPLRLLDEGFTGDGGRYADKSLGLWRLRDLEV
jgi:hypothetical protein